MEDKDHVCKNCYVCEGSCAAELSEEEHQTHNTKVCGTEGCSSKGQPFTKKECCEGHEPGAAGCNC